MICPQCGHDNRETARFCEDCGAGLLSAHPSSIPPSEPRITVFTPEPERKIVTALFSDLSGYTALTGWLDPEDVQEITGRIFSEIKQIVASYDGFIEKFLGDGVLVLFGVPQAHEDDPLRAIRAAREIHIRVEALSPLYKSKLGRPLSMHSGINTGLAVTTDMDSQRDTQGITGEAINVAARLSDLAVAGQILVGAGTFHRAEGQFDFRDLGLREIMGKEEPISIYEVLNPKQTPVTTHRLSGLQADLIGRRDEMGRLKGAAQRLQ